MGLTWIEQAGITTPFTTPLFPFIQTIGNVRSTTLIPHSALARSSIAIAEPIRQRPRTGRVRRPARPEERYAQQWNLSVSKNVRLKLEHEAGYLGSKLTNLAYRRQPEPAPAEQLALGPALTQQVPNPFFGRIPAHLRWEAPRFRFTIAPAFSRFTTVALYRTSGGHLEL